MRAPPARWSQRLKHTALAAARDLHPRRGLGTSRHRACCAAAPRVPPLPRAADDLYRADRLCCRPHHTPSQRRAGRIPSYAPPPHPPSQLFRSFPATNRPQTFALAAKYIQFSREPSLSAHDQEFSAPSHRSQRRVHRSGAHIIRASTTAAELCKACKHLSTRPASLRRVRLAESRGRGPVVEHATPRARDPAAARPPVHVRARARAPPLADSPAAPRRAPRLPARRRRLIRGVLPLSAASALCRRRRRRRRARD